MALLAVLESQQNALALESSTLKSKVSDLEAKLGKVNQDLRCRLFEIMGIPECPGNTQGALLIILGHVLQLGSAWRIKK